MAQPTETEPDPPRKIPSRLWLLALLLVIIIAFLFGPCQKVGEHSRGPNDAPSPAAAHDSLQAGPVTPRAPESPHPEQH